MFATEAPAVEQFHPAVRRWFEERFPAGPSEAQALGWPPIAAGQDTLIAAPTGSGKTLAGFLVGIDQLYRAHEQGEGIADRTRVVYVSPLKALGVDIGTNLRRPLEEIAEVARAMGLEPPDIRVEVRNGDTPSSARSAMVRRPPHFLVTTPESLYLLVTAERGRAALATVRTVIVDEIHAVAGDKRGSHLALSLERLERLCDRRPVRIGLSATQRPIETVARLLVGAGAPGPAAVVDVGHRRRLDLAIELPPGELEAVASNEQMDDMLDYIAGLVRAHRTTLVFVNTRRMAERLAHRLGERLGEEGVASHHGSLSRDRRLRVEDRLRAGELRALVATASLELGIDIGPVDLVCQIGSPRSIATFLQRVGRSGHYRGGTPKGRLFPLTRDELVECTALFAGIHAGRLDSVHPPAAPLDILAQQIVAECANQRWAEDDLYELIRRAAPYSALARDDFDRVVELVSEGIPTGRGRRAAYLHRDGVNHELAGRRGARLAALTSGGAIPETGDYRVVAEPDDTLVGTVNEDWAIESMAGDVFLLGSTSWRIRRVEPGTVRVVDAGGAPPTVPFWLGEAPGRTRELSEEVSALRAGVGRHLDAGGTPAAEEWVAEVAGVAVDVAAMVVRYLAASRTALGGHLPTLHHLVIERFFDDTGGMQLVVHAPFGSRVNRGLGLALRKRFCVSFDFELQAAASDDAVLLSLGPQHSFPLQSVPKFLSSSTVEQVLRQATLASPMFAARWRWNLNRSLAVLRFKSGRKNPAPIQRMESDDLMAAVFPALAACQENVTGPIQIPDHVLVRQTMHDCLHEAMDIDGLQDLIAGLEAGTISVTTVDTTEPSPLSHEIVNGQPYTFLDDAPLEERRSRAVSVRRGLPVESRDLAALDPAAIARVVAETAPDPRDADELHDLLLALVVMTPAPRWQDWYDDLARRGRALAVATPADGVSRWCAAELAGPAAALSTGGDDRDAAAARALRGHLDASGPVTADQLVQMTGITASAVAVALARLEGEGSVLRGRFDPSLAAEQWCARRLLARMHAYTKRRLRAEIEPVSGQDFMRFLLQWHGVGPGNQRHGRGGLVKVIESLQGFEVPAGSWETAVLPARLAGYRPDWLDAACTSGEVAWGRLGVRAASEYSAGGAVTSRATPVSLVMRADMAWLLQAARAGAEPAAPAVGATAEVLEVLAARGALFPADIATAVHRLPSEIDSALWDGVARGMVTADGFAAVRSLLSGRQAWAARSSRAPRGLRRAGRLATQQAAAAGGRWSLMPPALPVEDPDALAEAVAEQLLARWGVVVRTLLARETIAVPWRDVLWALRRMEARGVVRGGRFVSGLPGEQYALPEAVDRLRAVRRRPAGGETVTVSATDPLNLVGIVVPGDRVPAVRTNSVTYVDGLPSDPRPGAGYAGRRPALAGRR
jgi:ATP-dependent Lhr-like helicase